MSRLFVALLPPPEALAEVGTAVDSVRSDWPGLRWIDPALWHVTLAFLGDVRDEVLPELGVRLTRAAARHRPVTLSFAGAGAFPSAGCGRVFWLGLTAVPPLPRLADSVAAGARRAGAGETDRKRFHPHLTLARSRDVENLRDLVGSLSTFNGRTWRADAIHLVRSHLGSAVRYEPLDAYPLGG